MMDQFLEEVASKQKKGMEGAVYGLATVMMVVFALLTVVWANMIIMAVSTAGFSTAMIPEIVLTLVMGGAAVLLYLKKDTIRTEYEYTFTNGQLDFAQVFNNKKRKSLGTMNLKNLEAAGEVTSGSFQRYISMQGIKRSNWFVNREAKLFYLYYQKDGQKRIIIIEPSDEMTGLIKRALSQGVFQVN